MRLNAALVRAGLASSRRGADGMIRRAEVSLNGVTVVDFNTQVEVGDKLSVGDFDHVLVDDSGEIILLNKPKGYTCTHQAQTGQKTIFELLPKKYLAYKFAGRLDIDSRGLVVLCSNGFLAHTIAHPAHKQVKIYQVITKEKVRPSHIEQLTKPIEIKDKVVEANRVRKLSDYSCEISVSQGRNRQIRRMLGAVGLTVQDLKRTAIGKFRIDNIAEGEWQLVDKDAYATILES